MAIDPFPNRRSPRLGCLSYAGGGWWFVTCCVRGRRPVFGRVAEDGVALSDAGRAALLVLEALPRLCAAVRVDARVVMPDHVHAVLELEAGTPLGEVVRRFKTASLPGIRAHAPDAEWQRSYYDHLLRNESEIFYAREYIAANPRRAAARLFGAP